MAGISRSGMASTSSGSKYTCLVPRYLICSPIDPLKGAFKTTVDLWECGHPVHKTMTHAEAYDTVSTHDGTVRQPARAFVRRKWDRPVARRRAAARLRIIGGSAKPPEPGFFQKTSPVFKSFSKVYYARIVKSPLISALGGAAAVQVD